MKDPNAKPGILDASILGSNLTVRDAAVSLGMGLLAGGITYAAIRTYEHFADGTTLGILDSSGPSLLS